MLPIFILQNDHPSLSLCVVKANSWTGTVVCFIDEKEAKRRVSFKDNTGQLSHIKAAGTKATANAAQQQLKGTYGVKVDEEAVVHLSATSALLSGNSARLGCFKEQGSPFLSSQFQMESLMDIILSFNNTAVVIH